MTRTEKLNRLFDDWKRQRPQEAQLMCLDGIVFEQRYEKMKPKILFIAKEPNDPKGKTFDFREWWCQDGPQYAFSWRLCEWAYGIWNGFPPLAQFKKAKAHDIIRSIAFMNLKKVGGGNQANPDVILNITKRDCTFLRRQIAIIEPDVIVGSVGRDPRIWDVLFPDIQFQDSGFDINVAREGHIRVIDFYHPSYLVPRAMSYCLLGRVFGSLQ